MNYKELDRYKDFTFLDTPQPFSELFKDKKYYVQIHDVTDYDGYICGFCGAFYWGNNTLTPADGDSYTPNMMVLGYDEFEINDDELLNKELNTYKGLDILVEEW